MRMKKPSFRKNLALAVCVLGFTGMAGQMLFLREMMSAFHGNELTLGACFAVWLLWTAVGSGWVARKIPFKGDGLAALSATLLWMAAALPFTEFAIRSSRLWLRAETGEIVGFGSVVLTGLVVFGPFCLASGVAYAAACRAAVFDGSEGSAAAVRVYAIEAVGSSLGGLAAALLLFPRVNSMGILTGLAGAGAAAGLALRIPPPSRFVRAAAMIALIALIGGSGRLNRLLDRTFWKTGELLASENTAYGNVSLARLAGQITVYMNGTPLFTVPDEEAEEAVHFGLLEHPSPETVLLIGGSLGGAVEQVFRHPSVRRVTAVELDPGVTRLARRFLPPVPAATLTDSAVLARFDDGRGFLARSRDRYDVVLMNLPDPESAQLNRYYTVEFFRLVRTRLNPGGVFAFSLPSSENAVGKEQADLLGTVRLTLDAVFPETVLLPGDPCRFIGANGGRYLTGDPGVLGTRIRERGLGTKYVQPYFLNFTLSDERRKALDAALESASAGRINRDFQPLAFRYDLLLWISRFAPSVRSGFERLSTVSPVWIVGALALCVLASGFRIRKKRVRADGIRPAVLGIGFSGLAIELIVLFGHQTLAGVLYRDMALIVAGYMAGLAAGGEAAHRACLSSRTRGLLSLAALILGLGALPPVTALAMRWIHDAGAITASRYAFFALNAAAGMLAGWGFGLANRLDSATDRRDGGGAGRLYALDLAGGLVGSLFTATLCMPLFGVGWSLAAVTVVNGAALVPLLLSVKQDVGPDVYPAEHSVKESL
jgi:spermidine synthase